LGFDPIESPAAPQENSGSFETISKPKEVKRKPKKNLYNKENFIEEKIN